MTIEIERRDDPVAAGTPQPTAARSDTPRSRSTLLEVRGLRVTLPTSRGPVRAVRGIDLTIERGECVAIVGESGSGKSITARALAGLLPPRAEVELDAFDLDGSDVRLLDERGWRERRGRVVGFVLQDALVSLDPLRPLGAEVGEAIVTHRIVRGRGAVRERVLALLDSVGIPNPGLRARQYSVQLSGGLRQRGLIASGLSADPQLLIADEPSTALDVTVQAQVLNLLAAKKDEGTTILLISHDLAVVASIADRVLVMKDGVVVESGAMSEVLERPAHPYTQRLLRAIPSGESRGYRLSETTEEVRGDRVPLPRRQVSTEDSVVEVIDVHKHFTRGRTSTAAVDGVSFSVAAGETLGIVGESGSGKSTVARILLGLVEPDSGEVRVDGKHWSSIGERARRPARATVQLIAQDSLSSFDPRFTVGRIIGESLDIVGVRGAERRQRVDELLLDVGLSLDYYDRHPRSLSGGQRQRVAIARALAPRPKIIVADEPVSALDVSVQAQILDLLADIQASSGASLIFISHDLGVVHHIADRVVVMRDGVIVERGPVDEVFRNPSHPYTRELIAAVPALER
jgi:peptide/nickel transport system ATP-binding protein